jgi:CBS domain containing-hemolysin-like protein
MADPHDLAHDPDFQRYVYKILTFGSIALLAIGTVVFSALEDWSYVDSFYFSVVTASTVGFGDITPDTTAAKLFAVLYILFGISIIATFLDARFKYHSYKRAKRVR